VYLYIPIFISVWSISPYVNGFLSKKKIEFIVEQTETIKGEHLRLPLGSIPLYLKDSIYEQKDRFSNNWIACGVFNRVGIGP
jgi:hypothetical protein